MSSYYTDIRNQCNVGFKTAKLQVRLNFTFDPIQISQYIKKKMDILNTWYSSEECFWKEKQRVKYLAISWGKNKLIVIFC